jgi:hypothetical protein
MVPFRRSRSARIRPAPVGGLALIGLLVLGSPTPAQQAPPPAGNAPAAAPASSPLDAPLRLLDAAARTYQQVQTYSCLFIKQEQIRGRLQPVNVMAMKVRTQPFAVYFQWLAPANIKGQEACYVAGRNPDVMRVHATGVRGLAGFVSLEPTDPRVMENSRHTIKEAGIGNLITRYGERWKQEKQAGKTVVKIGEYDYDSHKCWRVEMVHPDPSAMQYYAYRSVVYFDKQSGLPIRVENYDWPQRGGALFESYSYAKLQLNVRLTDADFDK